LSTTRSLLAPERQPLVGHFFCSFVVHGLAVFIVAAVTLISTHCGSSRHIIDPDRAIEVSMVSLPKSKTSLPDRATVAPRPKGTTAEPTPEPVQTPQRESDLVVHKPDATPDPGADVARDQALAKLREQLLDQLGDAPQGRTDRSATDPNGVDGQALAVLGAGSRTDPEFARYIAQLQALFRSHFRPLGAVVAANPGIRCTMRISADPVTGTISGYAIQTPSGVPAYDAAAERATAAVGKIPLPPERYAPLLSEGFTVDFVPP